MTADLLIVDVRMNDNRFVCRKSMEKGVVSGDGDMLLKFGCRVVRKGRLWECPVCGLRGRHWVGMAGQGWDWCLGVFVQRSGLFVWSARYSGILSQI